MLHGFASTGAAFDIPGAARPFDLTSDEMLRDFAQHEGMPDNMQHCNNIYEQERQQSRPHMGFRPPDGPQARLIEPCLQVCITLTLTCHEWFKCTHYMHVLACKHNRQAINARTIQSHICFWLLVGLHEPNVCWLLPAFM